jgi:hypothetical protein
MNYQRSELFQFVSYNETTKVPKPFSAKIQKNSVTTFFVQKIFSKHYGQTTFLQRLFQNFSQLFIFGHLFLSIFKNLSDFLKK